MPQVPCTSIHTCIASIFCSTGFRHKLHKTDIELYVFGNYLVAYFVYTCTFILYVYASILLLVVGFCFYFFGDGGGVNLLHIIKNVLCCIQPHPSRNPFSSVQLDV